VFAGLSVALAATAHALAMNVTPSVATMAAAWAAISSLGYLMAARERSLPAICGAMALLQTALHLLFNATTPSGMPPGMTGAMANMPGMTAGMANMPGMTGAHHTISVHAMTAHALAALAAAWWLRRGEAAFWSLLRHAAALAPSLTIWGEAAPSPVVPPPRVAAPGHLHANGLGRSVLLRHAVIRRGPPQRGPVPVLTV
jgi:hypothetical protein